MKTIFGLLGLVALVGAAGCAVEPVYPAAGVSVGVYGEYPRTYYGHGGYYRWHHHPYDRDRYFYRPHPYWY
jgi:hypothetical protein